MKYTDDEKQKFRDLVAQGKSLKEAAKEAGISLAIGLKIRGAENRKKREESTPPPLGKPEEDQEEENLSEGAVPPPGPGAGGAADASGARGAEGARSALTDEEDDSAEKKEEATGDTDAAKKKAEEEAAAAKAAEAKKSQLDPAEILVNLSEMLCSGMVWIFAKRKKVKLSPQQKEELAWSEEERAHLLRHARNAVGAIPNLFILLGPYIGLAFYGWILVKVTGSRCEQVAEWGPRQRGQRSGSDEEIVDAVWEERETTSAPLNDMREEW